MPGSRLQVALAAQLDSCLLTQDELERGPEQWVLLEDPFSMISPQSKLLHTKGPIDVGGDGMVGSDDEAADQSNGPTAHVPAAAPILGTDIGAAFSAASAALTSASAAMAGAVASATAPELLLDDSHLDDGHELRIAAAPPAAAGPVDEEEKVHMVSSMRQLGPQGLFLVAIEAALFSWDPLTFVINEGNRDDAMEIAEWMCQVVAELFSKGKKVQRDEVEDYICDIIEAEFNLHFEEVSPETTHMARQICQFSIDCATGGTDPMFAFIYKVGKAKNRFEDHFAVPKLVPMEPEEEEEEEVVDPDGWETVKPKKKGGRN